MKNADIHHTGALFHDVQMHCIFKDSKTFPDCPPLFPRLEIAKKYDALKSSPDFSLRAFVKAHFAMPPDGPPPFRRVSSATAEEHIEQLWNVLTRPPNQDCSSLIPLKYPYVVPGGRFREVYYWDSYFTMVGLAAANRYDLIQSMVDNFAHLIDTFGHIPNGNRTYYLGRSQPPFFSLMVELLSRKRTPAIFQQYVPQLEQEYAFWMKGKADERAYRRTVRMPDGEVLNRYWDENDSPRPESYREDVALGLKSSEAPQQLYRHIRAAAESGWDFSSRCLHKPEDLASICTTEILPVDLNSLLWHLEKTLAREHPSAEKRSTFASLAAERKSALQKYFWHKTFF